MLDFNSFLIVVLCKTSLILGIVVFVMATVGRRWPKFCTNWQRTSIVAALLLPPAVLFLPTFGLPILPSSLPAETKTVSTDTALEFKKPNVDRPHVMLTFDKPVEFELQDIDDVLVVAANPICDLPSQFAGQQSLNLSSVELASPGVSKEWPVSLWIGFGVIYAIGVTVLMIRLFCAWRSLWHLKWSAQPVQGEQWHRQLSRYQRVLKINRPVELFVSDSITVPMTFGWIRPVILVPRDGLINYSRMERDAVLTHELTHIAQADFFWQMTIQMTSAFYWIHPLIWHIRHESEILRERLCDLLCSERLGQHEYATALVSIAIKAQGIASLAPGMAMAHQSSLGRRLNELNSNVTSRFHKNRTASPLACATSVLVLAAIVIGNLSERLPVPTIVDDQIQTTQPDEPEIARVDAIAKSNTSSHQTVLIDGFALSDTSRSVFAFDSQSVFRISPIEYCVAAPTLPTTSSGMTLVNLTHSTNTDGGQTVVTDSVFLSKGTISSATAVEVPSFARYFDVTATDHSATFTTAPSSQVSLIADGGMAVFTSTPVFDLTVGRPDLPFASGIGNVIASDGASVIVPGDKRIHEGAVRWFKGD